MAQLETVGNVIKHVVVGKKGIALEHHGGVALIRRESVDGLVAEIDLALVRAFKAGDHAQRRRFAAAGGTEQRDEFARLDDERVILDGVKSLPVLGS